MVNDRQIALLILSFAVLLSSMSVAGTSVSHPIRLQYVQGSIAAPADHPMPPSQGTGASGVPDSVLNISAAAPNALPSGGTSAQNTTLQPSGYASSSAAAADLSQTVNSPNWAGYQVAQSNDSDFAQVNASWTVPDATYGTVLQWIGISGSQLSGGTGIVQVGTLATAAGTDWVITERYPYEDMQYQFKVNEGDEISASITETSQYQWLVVLHDLTSGQSYAQTLYYGLDGDFADWIVEAPKWNADNSTALGNFGEAKFTRIGASAGGWDADLCGPLKITYDYNGSEEASPVQTGCDGFYVTHK